MQELRDALKTTTHQSVFDDLVSQRPTVWIPTAADKRTPASRNSDDPAADVSASPATNATDTSDLNESLVDAAEERFRWFAPLFEQLFPETRDRGGIIESPLTKVSALAEALAAESGRNVPANLWVKRDDALAVSGSVKSRGGIHEVLETALSVAGSLGIDLSRGPSVFLDEKVRTTMSTRRIVVGSTGNLGMSIGLMSAILGFSVTVHMSRDAKEWKKSRLRRSGVDVVEHDADFTSAVRAGRAEAEADSAAHFIDDENSLSLFAGYAVGARRLAAQLASLSIRVDERNPLFVYLPCGIGGAPGGISYELSRIFGDAVRCIFVEPVATPAFFLGRLTGLDDDIAVTDIELGGATVADGLAVGRPSGFVGSVVGHIVAGYATVTDEELLRTLAVVHESTGIRLEPSACAGLAVAGKFEESRGTHVAWLTGGSLIPDEEFTSLLDAGQRLLHSHK